MGDWMAYGSTVASHPNEEFGKGNIRGVIGPEGANNAQKATSMIPTVLDMDHRLPEEIMEEEEVSGQWQR